MAAWIPWRPKLCARRMADAFLDSSVVIGLLFRHGGEAAACRAALPAGSMPVCSRYVIFEVARGFLRSLITLHNASFEYRSFSELHQAAHSGQRRFRLYAMHTWLGAFDDYFAALEAEDGPTEPAQMLAELRAKLDGWIRRGWRRMHRDFTLLNEIGCREDLPDPAPRADGRLDQPLPVGECGQPAACRLQPFLLWHETAVRRLLAGLKALPAAARDAETIKRIVAIEHLLDRLPGAAFTGSQCHRCGDALICLEAPSGQVIASKNGKHFRPLAGMLGKPLTVVQGARSTVP